MRTSKMGQIEMPLERFLRRRLVLALAVLAAQMAFAWTWSGKTGDVTVDENATVNESDRAVVEALTGIHLNDGVKLTFANTSWLTLSAVLTGDGEIYVGDGVPVTFAGNSPDYTGKMTFLNSKICVTHSYALGSGKKKDGTSTRFVYSSGSYHASARPNADGLSFADGVACQPGIAWYGDREYKNKKGSVYPGWFSSNMTYRVTFNGPLYMNKSGNVDFVLLGNYTLNGEWGLNSAFSGGTPALTVRSGCTAYINGGWYVPQAGYCYNSVEANAELHLNSKITRFATGGRIAGSGTVICDRADVLPPTDNFALGAGTTLDLNGKDQFVALFGIMDHAYNDWKPKRGDTAHSIVTSSAGATLSVTGLCNQTYKQPYPVKFRGKAALTKTTSGEFTIVNVYSDTEGPLTVTGGRVKFDWGAGWGGDVRVSGANSSVVFSDGATLNSDRHSQVFLSAGATLELSNDVSLVCTNLTVDGTALGQGAYTKDTAATEGRILGDGRIRVIGTTCVWKGGSAGGWSDAANWEDGRVPTPGSSVRIPANATVTLTDADRSLAAGLGILSLEAGSLLTVATTEPLSVSADIEGAGAIAASLAGPITLSGRNVGHTGAMAFTNTTVVVASRTALGSPTRSVLHWTTYDADPTALLFTGAGLTNDVPLRIRGARHQDGRYFTENFSDPWVQNGLVEYVEDNTGVVLKLGEYRFNGGFKSVASAVGKRYHSVEVQANCTCDFSDGTFNFNKTRGRILANAGATVRLGSGSQWAEFFALTGDGRFVFDSSGSICNSSATCFGDKTTITTIDLNGAGANAGGSSILYNQNPSASDGAKGEYAAAAGDYGYAVVTSATPATATIGYGGGRFVAVKYRGQASLTRTGSNTYTIMNQYSDTTGKLTVTTGTVAFDAGAGWGGDIDVSSAGCVSFLKRCPQNHPSGVYGTAVVTGTGKINVAAGARYNCKVLKVGATADAAVTVPDGLYTIAQLQTAYGSSYFTGAGTIRVGQRVSGLAVILK